jgi:hypothetical protein
MKTGIELIASERRHQILAGGWTAEYDDQHRTGQLSAAGSCYADVAGAQIRGETNLEEIKFNMLELWPWDEQWFKPSPDPVSNLAKAGALIAAEIDRLQRLRLKNSHPVMAGQPEPTSQTRTLSAMG